MTGKRSVVALVALCFMAVQSQSCSALGSTGNRGAGDAFWLGDKSLHNGVAPYAPQGSGFTVFRNVKDFGARGDGSTDDTAAINAAITSPGGRCGQGCDSATSNPALVYFPPGKYIISSPIVQYYHTQLVGDANNIPTIASSANFQGGYMIQSDPYGNNGNNWWTNQNNFYRQVRNFIIDTRATPATVNIVGVHWQVAQATSLTNLVFQLNQDGNTEHQGIWMENGSGGFMSDLVIHGGKFGMWVGCQQFTSRNMTFYNSKTAIFMNWNWGWSFKGISINNCGVGLDLSTSGTSEQTGSVLLMDSDISNTPIGVKTSMTSSRLPGGAGTITLDNVQISNVPIAISDINTNSILSGGSFTIQSWGQGHMNNGTGVSNFVRTNMAAPGKNGVLLNGRGRFFERPRPQYEGYGLSDVVNVKSEGAVGDGVHDDTAALTATFKRWAGCKIIYIPFGSYVVTSTLYIPPGSRIVGESWAQIKAQGSFFSDFNNPKVAVQVGMQGQTGIAELSDLIFTTAGNTAGAIVVEWNLHDPAGQPGVNGMWDCHFRIGGASGTNMMQSNCPSLAAPKPECMGAFNLLHLTTSSSAYLENVWAWTADHDLDSSDGHAGQTSVFSGRGILIESNPGPVWMYGTAAEHNVMYQYSLVNAKNIFATMIQTETPYYQGSPQAPAPFVTDSRFSDPSFANCQGPTCGYAWGLNIQDSSAVYIYGAGLYNFFNNYDQSCLDTYCQDSIVNIKVSQAPSGPGIYFYNLGTKATKNMVITNGRPTITSATALYSGFCNHVVADLSNAGGSNVDPNPNPAPQPIPTGNPNPTPVPTTGNPNPNPAPNNCPSTLLNCNGACYSPDSYCCLNNQLTQIGFCGTPAPGPSPNPTNNPAPPPNPCPSTLSNCNGACYSPDSYCCPNGVLTQKIFC